MFEYLVWIGAAVSVAGLVGLLWCIGKVAIAKRKNFSDEDLRAEVQKVIPYNLGALLLSVLGLILVMVGLFLS